MAKIDKSTLAAMLASQRADALASMSAANLQQDRADAMDYYLGKMDHDMPAQDGRSRAVSTDVQDTIEGMLPQLMDEIAGSDEILRFNPTGPEDEDPAQQETDYVNYVLMQQNDGYRELYSFTKDGLLSKVGIIKVWWEEREVEERETYYNQSEDQFIMLCNDVQQSDGMRKIVEHTVNGAPEAAT